jgi:hypothetical protein
MKIIPYVMHDGSRSLPDSVMKNIYSSMRKHRLDRVVFSSGGVNKFDDFIVIMKNPNNVVHTIWQDDRIQLLAWLNNFGLNYAFGHFCCWPETWGKTSVALGKRTIDYWFGFKGDNGNVLDVILGFIPSKNKFAIRYIKKVGMTSEV